MDQKPEGFICDIDGTVASHVNADGSLRRKHYDYSTVSEDTPVESTIIVVRALINEGLEPVFVSGRADENNGKVRHDTVEWIREHVTDLPFNLYMRPEFLSGTHQRDFRQDYIVKEEIYQRYIHHKWAIKLAIDDRLQVCQKWHAMGIPVFRVGDPDAVF